MGIDEMISLLTLGALLPYVCTAAIDRITRRRT